MTNIHIPGQARNDPNPLLVLAAAADKTNQHLAHISTMLGALVVNTTKEVRHVYAIEERDIGIWGTYCLACSDAEQDYVYPCKRGEHTAPPSHISVLPDLKTD